MGNLKTNTALLYKDDFEEVELWGYSALYKRSLRKRKDNETKLVELFMLYLGNRLEKSRSKLPVLPVDYKKAITDYLREMGMVNK